jgi:hypothetical protein
VLFACDSLLSQKSESAEHLLTPKYSKEANDIFVSSIAENTDLNSGLTIERAMSLYSDQENNVSFAVFNHTNESITFPNQGFGITIFWYNDTKNLWEELSLNHLPYSTAKTLPPKLERWDFEENLNSRDVLENDVEALPYDLVRLYVSGVGDLTDKKYGAHIDITISR